MTPTIFGITVAHIAYVHMDNADIHLYFTEDCDYTEEELSSILEKFGCPFNYHFKGPGHESSALLGIGVERMLSLYKHLETSPEVLAQRIEEEPAFVGKCIAYAFDTETLKRDPTRVLTELGCTEQFINECFCAYKHLSSYEAALTIVRLLIRYYTPIPFTSYYDWDVYIFYHYWEDPHVEDSEEDDGEYDEYLETCGDSTALIKESIELEDNLVSYEEFEEGADCPVYTATGSCLRGVTLLHKWCDRLMYVEGFICWAFYDDNSGKWIIKNNLIFLPQIADALFSK